MQNVIGFKYLFTRKHTFYLRIKVPKRMGTREIKLCLRTKKLSVAVIVLERLSPSITILKELVITSRTFYIELMFILERALWGGIRF